MEGHSEILMSNRELGCRRINQQSQRYLNTVIKQLDYEKQLVQRDWDHKKKVLLAQKKKVMPTGWDPRGIRRPRSAWTEQDKRRHRTEPLPDSPLNAGKIPDHWKLCAQYQVTPSGARVKVPISPANQHSSAVRTKFMSRPKLQNNRFRRAASAPVRRTNSSSFLITQLASRNAAMEDVDEVFEDEVVKDEPESNETIVNETKNAQVHNVQGKPPLIRNRPVSACARIKNKNVFSNSEKTTVCDLKNSDSGSSSTLDSAGSFALLRQVIDLV